MKLIKFAIGAVVGAAAGFAAAPHCFHSITVRQLPSFAGQFFGGIVVWGCSPG